ncbi:MAG: phosphate acetyltransferase [Omnitrophica bacterium RIFCSPLOWO2_01_FULL_45_10]|nr:MAG: phosphate acetyltransferase [Omnitrophica bacterium RIFCSPLOWO2_01_FULL_45_10]
MSILDDIRKRAVKCSKKIVLPESEDARTLDAINIILNKKMTKIILVGEESLSRKIKGKNLSGIEIINPTKYRDLEALISKYYELRKHKGITIEEARDAVMNNFLIFGAMLVRAGAADGFVAGANNTTADVIRCGLRCLEIDKNIGVVSGAFLMEVPDPDYGEKGVFVFSDCAVNVEPDAKQLAGIAVSAAGLFKQLVGPEPRVALLSYSSKGSAKGPLVEKVKEALKLARTISPGILIDGELQADSAIVPEVALKKSAASEVAGRANVLIFPDLNSGNIGYKLIQRLANARAIGPLLQGFTRPASDLSRGCSVDDIVDAAAIIAVRA